MSIDNLFIPQPITLGNFSDLNLLEKYLTDNADKILVGSIVIWEINGDKWSSEVIEKIEGENIIHTITNNIQIN